MNCFITFLSVSVTLSPVLGYRMGHNMSPVWINACIDLLTILLPPSPMVLGLMNHCSFALAVMPFMKVYISHMTFPTVVQLAGQIGK